MNQLIGKVTQSLKFAEGTLVRQIFDEAILKLLGPKTEADNEAASTKKKKTKPSKVKETTSTKPIQKESDASEAESDPFAFFSKPEENHQVHTIVHFSNGEKLYISNTESQLKAHLLATGGKIYTRFPPEPNGYLHIGHAKVNENDFFNKKRVLGNVHRFWPR